MLWSSSWTPKRFHNDTYAPFTLFKMYITRNKRGSAELQTKPKAGVITCERLSVVLTTAARIGVIIWKEVSWIQLVKLSTAGVCNVEPIAKKRNALGEKIPLLQRCLSSCQQSELGGKLLHEFYCTVLGIVANVVSLINSVGGAERTLLNKKKQYPITKKVW